ncbi:MAG: nucleoside hydrolase [Bdellovibrionia bacterium]
MKPFNSIKISKIVLIMLAHFLLALSFCSAADKYWIDNDAGFDTDDQLANILSSYYLKDNILGVSTTLYHPDEKARINKLTFHELGLSVPVYPGEGHYRNNHLNEHNETLEEEFGRFLDKYPEWPSKQFKNPKVKNQGQAYLEEYGDEFERLVTSPKESGVQAIIDAARASRGKLVYIAQGPLTNLAKALKLAPDIAKMFKRVVVMGGWREDRLGYNSIIDYQSTKEVFDIILKEKVPPIILVNSDSLADKQLDLSMEEIDRLTNAARKSKIGNAILKDMKNWRGIFEKAKTMSGVALADPLAVFIGRFPDHPLLSYRCHQMIFNSKPTHDGAGRPYLPGEGITMLNHANLTSVLLQREEVKMNQASSRTSCPPGAIKVLDKIKSESGGRVPLREKLVKDMIKGLDKISAKGFVNHIGNTFNRIVKNQ